MNTLIWTLVALFCLANGLWFLGLGIAVMLFVVG